VPEQYQVRPSPAQQQLLAQEDDYFKSFPPQVLPPEIVKPLAGQKRTMQEVDDLEMAFAKQRVTKQQVARAREAAREAQRLQFVAEGEAATAKVEAITIEGDIAALKRKCSELEGKAAESNQQLVARDAAIEKELAERHEALMALQRQLQQANDDKQVALDKQLWESEVREKSQHQRILELQTALCAAKQKIKKYRLLRLKIQKALSDAESDAESDSGSVVVSLETPED
jgi:DNA repair exonuclease SbcCD ATPase subunit